VKLYVQIYPPLITLVANGILKVSKIQQSHDWEWDNMATDLSSELTNAHNLCRSILCWIRAWKGCLIKGADCYINIQRIQRLIWDVQWKACL